MGDFFPPEIRKSNLILYSRQLINSCFFSHLLLIFLFYLYLSVVWLVLSSVGLSGEELFVADFWVSSPSTDSSSVVTWPRKSLVLNTAGAFQSEKFFSCFVGPWVIWRRKGKTEAYPADLTEFFSFVVFLKGGGGGRGASARWMWALSPDQTIIIIDNSRR